MIAPTNTLRDRYRGKRVLLTGATGSLGQIVMEKIARALHDVGRLELLVRARRGRGAAERVAKLLATPLFDRARAEHGDFAAWCRERVVGLDGSLAEPRFGLDAPSWTALAGRIDAIIHVGAITSFMQPVDHVLRANTRGSQTALQLAKDAGDVPLVHVSTCYVCGLAEGTHAEEPAAWGHTPATVLSGVPTAVDPESEVQQLLDHATRFRDGANSGAYDTEATRGVPVSVLSRERLAQLRERHADARLARLGVRAAERFGWPDPYPMSKAFAEQLLVRDRGAVPLRIVRPSILTSTLSEPLPGWLDRLRLADPLIVAGGRGLLQTFPGDPGAALDLMPCDLAANAVLLALPEERVPSAAVYQVASSATNPLTLADFHRMCLEAVLENPFIDRHGRPIVPTGVRLAPPEMVRRRWWVSRRLLRWSALLCGVVGLNSAAHRIRHRLRALGAARHWARAFEPYTTRRHRFLADAIDDVRVQLTDDDRDRFPVSAGTLDWDRYLRGIHVPAVRRLAGGAGAEGTTRTAETTPQPTADERSPVSP